MRLKNMKIIISKYKKNSISKMVLIPTYLFFIISLSFGLAGWAKGQNTSSVEGGKSAGTYNFDNFANINLFNGNMNFSLPLAQVNGRGDAGVTIPLTIETRWVVQQTYAGGGIYQYAHIPQTMAGVMVNGPGKLAASISTYDYFDTVSTSCPSYDSYPSKAKLKLNFMTSDGTSHELRSTLNGGEPFPITYCYGLPYFNHGKKFISWDGSGVTFIADSDVLSHDQILVPNGYLLLTNGIRYRIEGGVTIWIEDRNGNRTTFSYTVNKTTITDSIDRQTVIDYNQNASPYGWHTKITQKGFNGTHKIIRVASNGATVWLPDGRTYLIQNGIYGVTGVATPTGAVYQYDYNVIFAPVDKPQKQAPEPPYIRVSERRVYADGLNLSQKTTFAVPTDVHSAITTVDNFDGNGTRLSRSKHYFHGDPVPFNSWNGPVADEDPFNKGREYRTEHYSSDGTTLLRKNETEWEAGRYEVWNPYGTGNTNIYRDARIASVTSTLADSNQVSKIIFGYDSTVSFNLQTDSYDYDYGSGQPGNFVRRSHTDYNKGAVYTTNLRNLITLPTETWASSDINGNVKVSRSQYEYDNYTSDANHAPLIDRSNIIGHNSSYGTGFTTRGNVTKVTSYADAQNQTGAISVYSQYDIAGNVVKMTDAKGYASTVDYTDRFGLPDSEARSNSAPSVLNGQQTYAFATSATNIVGYTGYTQFDYYSGAAVDSEDLIGNVSTTFYDDILGRPTQTISANNRPQFRRQSTFIYDDLNRKVTVTADSKAFGDNLLKSESFYDKLGRTFETRSYETPTIYIRGLTEYDALSRAYKSSTPHRPDLNEQPEWTTTSFDSLSRVTQIKTPDNAIVSRSYFGSTTMVADQANRKRTGVSDALGRLLKVIEDPNGLNYETISTYDVLGRLRKTTQTEGQTTQNRYFMYNDLGRLIRAKQTEQVANPALSITDPITGNSGWSVSFSYDANGNIVSTTDANNRTITGVYDNLNRLTFRDYSEASMPDVTFTFDDVNIPNSKGQLTAVTSSVSSTFYTAFDELGRIKSSRQTTNGTNYNFPDYTYDLSGALVSQTYPSGRIVETESDDIGRLSKVTSQIPSQVERTYLSNLTYTSFGAVQYAKLGNGKWESAQFDPKRLQTEQISLGSSAGNAGLLKIEYDFGTTDNNGSLRQQKITVPGASSPIIQDYTYDMLNRLRSATERVNSQVQWKQTFSYDRFGNRRFDAANTTTLPANNNIYNPQIDMATNKFTVAEGYNYDADGNLISNPESQLFAYDAENRQTQVQNTASQTTANYFYDGSGKRVRKVDGQGETVFVYDAFGKLVAEYATIIDSRPKATSYLTTDDLGSPRIVTNQLGQVVSRHDYLPFGEEVLAGAGGRTTLQGYGGNDGVRKQFTGYERDIESGLDYAQARYFKAGHGRFTSVDPLAASASIKNPQTLNRYTYGLNSPYKFTDPLGLAPCGNVNSSGTFGNACTQADDVKDKCPPDYPSCQTDEGGDYVFGSDGVKAYVDNSPPIVIKSEPGCSLNNSCSQNPTAGFVGVPHPGLDVANAPPLQSVEGIARLAEAGSALPGVGIPLALIGAGIRGVQGDAAGAGGNLLGVLPGFGILKRGAGIAKAVGSGDDGVRLFRGVPQTHEMFGDALKGTARPLGTHSDALRHNIGDSLSAFTSWTTRPNTAKGFAGFGGVVLQKTFRRSELISSPDKFGEGEVLIKGVITGCKVIRIRGC